MISDEDISLAWSPMPPFESTGAGDCRPGGSSGIDFNSESRRAKWVRARHRYLKEQRRWAQLDMLSSIEPGHIVCPCLDCCHDRLLRMILDLNDKYGPPTEFELDQKETVQ